MNLRLTAVPVPAHIEKAGETFRSAAVSSLRHRGRRFSGRTMSVRHRRDGANERRHTMTQPGTKPGRGYIYVEMTIKDPELFKNYTALSAPAVRALARRRHSSSFWASSGT